MIGSHQLNDSRDLSNDPWSGTRVHERNSLKKHLAATVLFGTAFALSACGDDDANVSETTDDGTFIKEIGEWGGSNCSDALESCTVQFRLDAVETGEGCRSFGYETFAEGADDLPLIQLDTTLTLSAQADEADQAFNGLAKWQVERTDGVTETLDHYWECYGDGIGPNHEWSHTAARGTTVEHRTVYRLPVYADTLILFDDLTGLRWQWDLPASE